MKRITVIAALAAALILTACTSTPGSGFVRPDTAASAATDSASSHITEKETDGERTTVTGTDPVTEAPLPVTAKPEIKGVAVIGPGDAIVYGECEENCRLSVTAGDDTFDAVSDGAYFAVPVKHERSVTVSVRATAAGKTASEAAETLVKYDKRAEDKGVTVTLGSRVIETRVLPDLYGTNKLDKTELRALRRNAEKRVAKAAEAAGKKVDVIYIIVPDPMTVYPGEMTREMEENTVERSARMTQVVNALKEVEGVTVVDLTAAMTENRDKGKLYYKLDSHWTWLGAYYGYAEFMRAIGAEARQLSDFEVRYKDIDDTDINVYSGVGTGKMFERAPFLTPLFEPGAPYWRGREQTARIWSFANEFFNGKVSRSEVSGAELGSALFLFDSYGFNIIPYLAEHYSSFVTQPVWRYSVDYSLVSEVKPDQIIELLAERDLGELVSAS